MGVLVQYESNIGGIDTDVLNKIGSDTLTTTSKNLSGAVNELNSSVETKVTKQYVDDTVNSSITQVINNSY